MLLVCSTSVTADRDQQHRPQSWPPADRKPKWKNFGPHDVIPRLPHHQRRKFQAHDTHLCQLVGNLHHISWLPAHVSLAVNVTSNWLGFFFFVHVGLQDSFSVLQMVAGRPLLKSTEIRVFKSATRSSASLLLIIINWKLQDGKKKQLTTFVVYQCEKMSRLGHATVKILTSVMCRKKNIVTCGYSR